MRERGRNQLAATAVLLMLFLLSLLIASNLNKFALPLSSNVFVPPTNKGSSSNAEGVLHITIESNLTVFPSPLIPRPIVVVNKELTTVNNPVQKVVVSITNLQTHSRTTRTTDSYGQLEVFLPAAEYLVEFVDWRLNYSSFTVEIHSGKMTLLQSYLNATFYPAQAFNIVDPDSSGYVVGWQQLYMLVPTTNLVSGSGTSTFINTGTSTPLAVLSNQNPGHLTSVSVVGRLEGQNSEWLSVQVGSPVAIQDIQGLQFLSINATYRVSSVYLVN